MRTYRPKVKVELNIHYAIFCHRFIQKVFQKSQVGKSFAGSLTIYLRCTFFSVHNRWYTWADKSNGDLYACEIPYKASWTDYASNYSVHIGGLYYSRSGSSWCTELYFSPYANRITGSNNNYHTMKLINPGSAPINGGTYDTEIIW